MKKQLELQRKDLVEELMNMEEIKNPVPEHEQLLTLCRLDGISTSELRDMSSFRYPIIRDARKFIADDICKKIGFSEDEQELHLAEVFKSWYSFARKRGRKSLDPTLMVAMKLFITHKQYIDRDFDCTTTMESFWANIVLPCANKRGLQLPEFSQSTKYSIFKTLCPKLWRGNGRWAVKSRKAALMDPCGALSMAAAWPIVTAGVDPKCMVFWDKMTHLIGHEPPKRCRVPKEIMELLRTEKRTPTFTKGMGQERSFGITVGLQKESGLLSCTFHICDETLTEILCEKFGPKFHVMFEPYSAKSERRTGQLDTGGIDVAVRGGEEAEAPEELSLALRIAGTWAAAVQIPAMKQWRDQLQKEAQECGVDPYRYKSMILSCDGEHSHLHNLLDEHAATMSLLQMWGFKLPAGHSGNVAVPDVAPIFPAIHKQLITGMMSASDEEIDRQLSDEPGLNRVVLILMGLNGMSQESKLTFKKSLVLAYSIVRNVVNVSAVAKGMKDACIFPFNREKMIAKMWPTFTQLPRGEKDFVLETIDGPISDEIRLHGWCKSSSVEIAIKRRETSIVFPPRSRDFDRFQWNRQTAVIFSHLQMLAEHRSRRENAVAEQQAAVQRTLNKEEENQRIMFRKQACSLGTDAPTGKTKCGCGRTFDGMSGFKSHEKCAHHQTFYATRDWEREFAISQAPQAPALRAPGSQ
jgi:hypothetical protein